MDHFRPPLAPRRHWESFHVNWAGAIADALNESLLPEGYFAEEHAQLGPWVEIDVAIFNAGDAKFRAIWHSVKMRTYVVSFLRNITISH